LALTFWLALGFSVAANAPPANRLVFHLNAIGPGELAWGMAGLGPGIGFGEPEYKLFFEDGILNLEGTSLMIEVYDYEIFPDTFVDGYILKEGSARIAGHLILKWVHDGSRYELDLTLRSTEETSGIDMHSAPGDNPYGLYRFLLVGINLSRDFPEMLDPEYATLTCQGWYKADGVMERIDGKAYFYIAFNSLSPDGGEPKE